MKQFAQYAFEANISLLIFLLCYKALFRSETSFQFMRFFLLTGILASLAIPLFDISYGDRAQVFAVNQVLPSAWMAPDASDTAPLHPAEAPVFTVNAFVTAASVYFIVLGILLARLVLRMRSLSHTLKRGTRYTLGKYTIIESLEELPAFSFFNFIYIGRSDNLTAADRNHVIRHECIHASQFHSADILLLNVVQILFWFNPFIRTYKKALIELHEYDADARTLQPEESDAYCNLLARMALQTVKLDLANYFNHSFTLKRINMIRLPKKKIQIWKFIVAATALVFSFIAISCSDQTFSAQNNEPLIVVDQSAQPEGGMDAFYTNFKRHARYPAEARKNKIQGKVLLQFVVGKQGDVAFKILDSPDNILTEEVLRLLKALPSPKWTPGKYQGEVVSQKIILPLKFKLADVESNVENTPNPAGSISEIVIVGYGPK